MKKRLCFLKKPLLIVWQKVYQSVTPAKAGVQKYLNSLDSRFHGNDDNGLNRTFYEFTIIPFFQYSNIA